MEIFSELFSLDSDIYKSSEPIDMFRYYRYQRRLLEENSLFGSTDHLSPDLNTKRKEIRLYSSSFPAHIPQHYLARILKNKLEGLLDSNDSVHLNTEFHQFENNKVSGKFLAKNKISNKIEEFDSSFVVACDGFRSTIRPLIGSNLIGDMKLQSFLNIHLVSKKLAQLICDKKQNAMLHFVYNSKAIAVFVNHSYENGEFVVQVPIFPETQPLESFNKEVCIKIIRDCIDKGYQLSNDEIEIRNFGFWNLSGVIADKYHKESTILCGDAAHSFPPAGGFGMNTGVQDAYNLAYKLAYLIKNDISKEDQEKVLTQYTEERKSHAHYNLSIAMKYYQNSLNIANYMGNTVPQAFNIGLKKENLDIFKASLGFAGKLFPKNTISTLFDAGKTVGSYHLEAINPTKYQNVIGVHPEHKIPLIFMDQETCWKYNYNNISDKFRGMLCPHIFIKDIHNKEISLRNLADYLFQNGHSDKSESFYIAINLSNEPLEKSKVSSIVTSEPVKGKIIYVSITTVQKSNNHNSTADPLAFKTEYMQNLFNRLGLNSIKGLILRSDSTLISIL